MPALDLQTSAPDGLYRFLYGLRSTSFSDDAVRPELRSRSEYDRGRFIQCSEQVSYLVVVMELVSRFILGMDLRICLFHSSPGAIFDLTHYSELKDAMLWG